MGARDNLKDFYEDAVQDPVTKLFTGEIGKFRTSSLRNIEHTAPYTHNGYFATLEEMIQFLNSRAGSTPEVTDNLTSATGDLGLAAQDEADLVEFLKTLTDGYGHSTPSSFVLPPKTEL